MSVLVRRAPRKVWRGPLYFLGNSMDRRSIRVCFVQPVQSPYWSKRFLALGDDKRLCITLLLERASLLHRPGWTPSEIENVSVEVLDGLVIPSSRKSKEFGYQISGVRSLPWRLLPWLWRNRPDVVVLCNAGQLLFAIPVAKLLKIKVVLIVEDTPHATRNAGFLPRLFKKWLYKTANLLLPFSDDAERFLHEIGCKQSVERSSWSLDMELFSPGGKWLDCRPALSVRKKVIFIGAMVNNKGVKQLMDAWDSLPESLRMVSELTLVGTGPLMEEVKAWAMKSRDSRITITGQVPYLAVRDMLRVSDLLVLPTLQDLYSLTVLEAMACGCPVITTPFNGARELVEEGKTGWVVDPTCPGQFVEALRTALSGESDLARMGRNARERVSRMDNVVVMRQLSQSLQALFSERV